MSATTFANHSKTAPNPNTANHGGGGGVQYTCHMAAIHWAFMERGDSQATANQKVSAINVAKCPACQRGHHVHGSLDPIWYGTTFCVGVAQRISNRATLYGAVNIGDVLIVGPIGRPSHTMVVVNKRAALGRTWVYIRGFNNLGTLGTGTRSAYDNNDRDIDKDRYWWPPSAGGNQEFGNGKEDLHVIPYNTYSNRAGIVRGHCYAAHGGGTITYNGS